MAHSGLFDAQLNLALLTVAALAAIFKPSLQSFVFLAVVQLTDALLRMPHTTNHWLFTAFVNLTALHVVISTIVSEKKFEINEGVVFSRFAPLVRIELIILYTFAVFHKLNGGFFTPDTSCATALLKAQPLDGLVRIGAMVFYLNAYFTVILEALIPLLLCFSRTRGIAVILGIIFHAFLGFSSHNPFYDFSSMVFAAYFLFMDPAFVVWVIGLKNRAGAAWNGLWKHYSLMRVAVVLGMVMVAAGGVYALSHVLDNHAKVRLYFFWTLYCLGVTGLIAGFLLQKQRYPVRQRMFTIGHWSFVLFPVIVFLNGTSPYLGLKTENSYAMFSNLRTEGGTSNHFIVPANAQLFDYQQHVVQIVSSTDPGLQELAASNKAMVLFEFRNYVKRKNPERVHYILNGTEYFYDHADIASAQQLGNNPFWLSKLFKFRAFSVSNHQPCSH